MYAPPHDFAVNIPASLAGVRLQTYRRYAWPRRLSAALGHGWLGLGATSVLGLVMAALAVWLWGSWPVFFSRHPGPGAFYEIIPYLAMVVPGVAVSVFIVAVLWGGLVAFWRGTGAKPRTLADPRTWAAAIQDAASLRYMRGGGPGCYYPERFVPSGWRRLLHGLVLYGFLVDCLATTLAAVFQDLLGQLPPFPLLSPPVLLGTAGGIAMIVGATGLIYLKIRSDPIASTASMTALDLAFLAVLDLASITGMLTLILRGTGLLGTMLTLHLAVLVALYFTAPYGKFVHFVYRVGALVLNSAELRQEAASRRQ
jgi:citrate/tricarballylate utilization protein